MTEINFPNSQTDLPNATATQPNIAFLRKQAKALLKSMHAGDVEALRRFAQHRTQVPDNLKLADAQWLLAREYGFTSWPRLKAYIDSITDTNASRFRAIETELSFFEGRAQGLLNQHASGLALAAQQIQRTHPGFQQMSLADILASPFTLADARLVTAREHGRSSWRSLQRWVHDLASGETIEPFHSAFLAIKAQDTAALEMWLRRDPSLIRASGTNGNTLIGLAVSVGNFDAISLLAEKGADINAPNVRGWTLLHQAGYSNRVELAEWLLARGADPTLSALGDGGTPLAAALFWGNVAVAEALVRYGVLPMNLRTAAAVGRKDLVASFFTPEGTLKPEAGAHRAFYRPHSGFPVWQPSSDPKEILDEAFVYAAKSGRTEVLELLLAYGADINADPYRGSALHWVATKMGMEPVAEWLIAHGADPSLRATFGGPQHGEGVTPMHLAAQSGHLEMVKTLVRAGADRTLTDDLYNGDPANWASHFGHTEIADYLRNA